MGDLLGEEYKGFFKWSHCNGWPTQMKNAKIFQNDLIVCPSEKCKYFSKWFHCNGRPAQVKNTKIFQNGLIVMGDLLKWKIKRFLKVVSL
jgi:hypothetical protein